MCEHNDVQTLDTKALISAKNGLGWGNIALIQGHVSVYHTNFNILSDDFEPEVDRHISARLKGLCDGGNLGKTNCRSVFTSQQRG